MVHSRPRDSAVPATSASANLQEAVIALTDQVKELTEQVRVLWNAIDDIRQEFEWAVRNDRMRCQVPVMHITSLPKDPCASDFGARINAYTPQNTPEAFAVPGETEKKESAAEEGELF